ncbi:hypothetical protein NDU88_002138 [Pleurodeles waltl]|uniref:Uncharacterized protein n=1 Tax=Pleurodeles waltl TaxID=8319 RepID=A0AAV7TKT2_PLEWA|nr:hypothetical protein NDU88_002138 [Pleurodeles waltl]
MANGSGPGPMRKRGAAWTRHGEEAGAASSPLALTVPGPDLEDVLKVIQDLRVAVDHKVGELRIDLLLVHQDLRGLALGGSTARIETGDTEERRSRRQRTLAGLPSWRVCGGSAPGHCGPSRRGGTHDHPAHDLQEE